MLAEDSSAASFLSVVEAELGLDLALQGALARDVLARRARAHGARPADYVSLVTDAGAQVRAQEWAHLARELTIGETYFHRHQEQLEALVSLVAALPEEQAVRVLSAGCSTGEEAFTVAMLLQERLPGRALEVVGVDVNPGAVALAERAAYGAWALRSFPPQWRPWLRETSGGGHEVAARIRALVRFEVLNLCAPSLPQLGHESFDVVLCRNVLMYMSLRGARVAMGHLLKVLKLQGAMLLGHAESPRGLTDALRLQHAHGAFFYVRSSQPLGGVHAGPAPASAPKLRRRLNPGGARAVSAAPSLIEATPDERGRVRAMELLREERFHEALAALGGGSQRDDGSRGLLRAVLLFHVGDTEGAETIARGMFEREISDAHYLVALCREARGDIDGAMASDRLAIEIDPRFAMPRLHLGMCSRQRGRHPDADVELRAALQLLVSEDPDRILLFGGGLGRAALLEMCRAELATSEVGR